MNSTAEKYEVSKIDVTSVRVDGGTQPRAAIYQNVIDDYADALGGGAIFPPVVVFYDGTDYWLADGFHRHAAHKKAGISEIDTDIRQGTRRDAVLYSVGANGSHGLRRTNEDKRRAVMTLLNDNEWGKWSDREIARRSGVSQPTVSSLRNSNTDKVFQCEERTFTHPKTGQPTVMQTSNIGRGAAPTVEVRETSEHGPSTAAIPSFPEPSNDNTTTSRLASYSGDNEWYTPSRYVDLARKVLGVIDVDPASNDYAQATVRAETFYTAETNGLDKEWRGKVWMNPPYSNPEIQQFTGKIIEEFQSGRCTEAIVLTNNSGDTGWHHELCDAAMCWCITRGRIKFESPTRESGSGAMGQVFFYFGPNRETFKEAFSEIGRVDVAL